jgi:hypothetical protein
MITFAAPEDREMLAELKEAGLVTPIVLEAIHHRLDRMENPDLNGFLLAGAEVIDELDWLSWLIRRHGCYRFGPVRLGIEVGSERWTESPNLPYAVLPVPQEGMRKCLAGVLRPDLPVNGLRAAATLKELRQLKADWERRK